jgi:beta-galactosidase
MKFYFGADYYPEHWPEERWLEDARLMKSAGFNLVRLAEFAWAKMEHLEGQFDFAWLDRAIQILSVQGIQIVLGTPTASPPPWLMAKQADLFLVGQDGVRLSYGSRREYCPNHPLYRQHTERIVTAMAEHYHDNPAVIGWQIDNEFGNRCFCEICADKFHKWLQERYQTLDMLNTRWGTIFWSHIYTSWAQIPAPLNTAGSHNPSLALDYYRYMSDTYREYQKFQIDILRRICPKHFVTHNLMGFKFNQLNYYDNSADLDFVSWDNYPRTQWDMHSKVDPARAALSHDTMRGLKKQNFWVMEQQSGGGGWENVAIPPKPGEIRLWTYQAIAHGAEAIVYFRWRTSRSGTEQNWQGILEQHGIPGRRYKEVSQIGRELQQIGEKIAGAQLKASIAIMQSYDARFAFQVQPNNPRFSYEKHVQDIYRGFFNNHVNLDIVSENDPLVGYKVIVVPSLYILTETTTETLKQFVEKGGIVVFTPRTGVKDNSNLVVNSKLPGLVSKLCGIEIEEYVSLPIDEDNKVQFELPQLEDEFNASGWVDVLKPNGAEVIAYYSQDYYAGKPAATINSLANGKVIYLGFLGDDTCYDAIASWLISLIGIEPLLDVPAGLEVVERCQGDRNLIFVLNHSSQQQEIFLETSSLDLLSGKVLTGLVELSPFDVLILTREKL